MNAPTILVQFPTNHQHTGKSITISGTFAASSGFDKIRVHVYGMGGTEEQVINAATVGTRFGQFIAQATVPTTNARSIKAVIVASNGISYPSGWILVHPDVETATNTNAPPDTNSPVVTVSSPTNWQKVGPTYQVVGTVSDDRVLGSLFIRVDSSPWFPVLITNGGFATNISLSVFGSHTNEFYATDGSGNVSATNAVIVVRASIPSISIDPSTVPSLTNSQQIHVRGSAAADDPMVIDSIRLRVNGSNLSCVPSSDWEFPSVSLQTGTNTIQAEVGDNNFQSNQSPVFTIICDPIPPVASLTNFTSGAVFSNTNQIAISGISTDNSGPVKETLVSIDGDAFQSIGTNGFWTGIYPLPDGAHQLKVFAKDLAGNSSLTQAVDFSILHTGEQVPPVIFIYPQGGDFASPVTLRTAVTDNFDPLPSVKLSTNGGTNYFNAPRSIVISNSSAVLVYGQDSNGNTTSNSQLNFTIQSNMVKVHFKKPANYTKPIPYIWAWNTSTNYTGGNWPGVVMTNENNGWFFFSIGVTNQVNVIFSDQGANQSSAGDLVTGEKWFKNGFWSTENPDSPYALSLDVSMQGGLFTNSSLPVTLSVVSSNILKSLYTLDGSDPTVFGIPFINGQQIDIASGMIYGQTKTLRMYAENLLGTNALTAVYTYTNQLPKGLFSWKNALVYFVFMDRFTNGRTDNDHSYGRPNPDGSGDNTGTFYGGDLAGMNMMLSNGYFTNLGVNVIWLNAPYEQMHGWVEGKDGAFAHYAYHGYYPLDWTCMDANFGTTSEFQTFVDTAHSQGIRVILDVVMNHTSPVTIQDMKDFNFGAWKSGSAPASDQTSGNWSNYYWSTVDAFNNSSAWQKWWGSSWVAFGYSGYTTRAAAGYNGDSIKENLLGLDDMYTETNIGTVSIPPFLGYKWSNENRFASEVLAISNYINARPGFSWKPRFIIMKWLCDWVERYGIDGFRIDTAKHVEKEAWKELKIQADNAFNNWKTANPTKVLDTNNFWMTGEHWNFNAWDSYNNMFVYDSSYFNNGFDNMIDFGFQNDSKKYVSSYSSSMDSVYGSNMTSKTMGYLSSHDTFLMFSDSSTVNGDHNKMNRALTYLFLNTGPSQIFYGDEYGRSWAASDSTDWPQGTRSQFRWDEALGSGSKADILAHSQKVGQFRNRHVAVGAGTHASINNGTPYVFSRIFTQNGFDDRVVCSLGGAGSVTVNVSTVFSNGSVLHDAYSGTNVTNATGSVTLIPQNEVLLLEYAQ